MEQDPDDEQAAVLLERIAAEKQTFARVRKAEKLDQSLTPNGQPPFELSNSWEWERLGNLALNIHYGYTASANFSNTDVRLLRITDIQDNHVNWATVPGCVIDEKDIPKYLLDENDILIARTGGTIGKSYLVTDITAKAVFASYLIRVIPSKHLSSKYMKLVLDSPLYWEQLTEKSKGTGQPNVNATSLSTLAIPLPPLNEQKRIVAKVGGVLGQTRVLAGQMGEVEAKRKATRQTAVRRLVTAVSPDEVALAWEFIAQNFHDLYTEPAAVQELKQAILQLAVQGRLVEQDPDDEPIRETIVEDICEVRGGIQKSPNRKPNKNPKRYLTVAHVQWNRIDTDDPRYFEVSDEELERWRLLAGDVLVVEGNGSQDHIGRTAIFKGEIEDCVHQNHVIRVRPNQARLTSEYLNLCFTSPYGRDQMIKRGRTTSGLYTLSVGRIKTVKFPLPGIELQKRIVARVDELFSLCDRLAAQLATAQITRERAFSALLAQAV
ncbi:MAG TPA: restriction endonuclease subunit S [Chloroflexota bacterium]|nr:restriction endonuclease subunit S [Chloroflexota bacterium]